MQYIAKSRMLQRQKSISQVAAAVGYDAEAAFNREFGVPPARWRDQQVAASCRSKSSRLCDIKAIHCLNRMRIMPYKILDA